jgi:hypothetical protein
MQRGVMYVRSRSKPPSWKRRFFLETSALTLRVTFELCTASSTAAAPPCLIDAVRRSSADSGAAAAAAGAGSLPRTGGVVARRRSSVTRSLAARAWHALLIASIHSSRSTASAAASRNGSMSGLHTLNAWARSVTSVLLASAVGRSATRPRECELSRSSK